MTDARPAPTNRSWWLTAQVLGGAYPGDADPTAAVLNIAQIEAAGVTLFVDLTTPEDRLEPYEALLTPPVRRVNLPVPDFTAPKPDVLDAALTLLDLEAAAGGIAYVHCWGGRGRTGSVLGCWLAREIGGDQALQALAAARVHSADAAHPAPETTAQRSLVRGWLRTA